MDVATKLVALRGSHSDERRIIGELLGEVPAPPTVPRSDPEQFQQTWSEVDRSATDPSATAFRGFLSSFPDRRLFHVLAYQPQIAVREFGRHQGSAGRSLWAPLAALYQAAMEAADNRAISALSLRAQATGAAYLARTWFLLLSVPFRPDGRCALSQHNGVGPDLQTRARQARDVWLDVLDRIEDYPLLLAEIDVETELGKITDTRIGDPLADDPGSPDEVDKLAWRRCVRGHLLPRFALCDTARVTRALSPPAARGLSRAAAASFLLAVALTAVTLFWPTAARWIGRTPRTIHLDGYAWATVLAGLGYLLIVGAATRERAAAWPWLLRQAAAAAVGVLGLGALSNTWWLLSGGPGLRWRAGAAVAMALLSYGYLCAEAANHGVRRVRIMLRRTTGVFALGLVHAFAVSLIALRWIIPVITDSGGRLAGWWQPAGRSPDVIAPWALILFATAWSLAAGVFLQLLWQDLPITAPLSHVEWRSSR